MQEFHNLSENVNFDKTFSCLKKRSALYQIKGNIFVAGQLKKEKFVNFL